MKRTPGPGEGASGEEVTRGSDVQEKVKPGKEEDPMKDRTGEGS